MASQISLDEARTQARKILPLWHPIPAQDLTPFLVGVKELCIDWVRRIHADQNKAKIRPTPQPRVLRVEKTPTPVQDWEKPNLGPVEAE